LKWAWTIYTRNRRICRETNCR